EHDAVVPGELVAGVEEHRVQPDWLGQARESEVEGPDPHSEEVVDPLAHALASTVAEVRPARARRSAASRISSRTAATSEVRRSGSRTVSLRHGRPSTTVEATRECPSANSASRTGRTS